MGVILVWLKWFAPKPPIPPAGSEPPASSAPAPTGSTSSPSAGTSTQKQAPPSASASAAPAQANAAPPKAASQEASIVVENALYRVEFLSRGGVVKSWQLKNYLDDNKPQRVLDLVHAQSSEQLSDWPMALQLDDAESQKAVNSALYVV